MNWREIPLTRGYVAIVDADDYEDLAQFTWSVVFPSGSGPYAKRDLPRVAGRKPVEYMHRRLLPDVPNVDHVNHNGIDNRRSNLRAATTAQNNQNQSGLRSHNSSGYRGVGWRPSRNLWRARIQGRHLGHFATAEEAARAFDAAAVELYGEFHGYLNFPDEVSAA